MTIAEMLAGWDRQGIHLYLEDGKLRCRAEAGQLNDTIKQAMRENKSALLSHLSAMADTRDLVAQVEHFAIRNPQNAALVLGGESCDYQTLHQRSLHMAGRVATTRSNPEGTANDLVLVLLPQEPDLVASILGAWRLGLSVACLDTDLPSAYLQQQLTLLNPSIVISTNKLLESLTLVNMANIRWLMIGIDDACDDHASPRVEPSGGWWLPTNDGWYLRGAEDLLVSGTRLQRLFPLQAGQAVWCDALTGSEPFAAALVHTLFAGATYAEQQVDATVLHVDSAGLGTTASTLVSKQDAWIVAYGNPPAAEAVRRLCGRSRLVHRLSHPVLSGDPLMRFFEDGTASYDLFVPDTLTLLDANLRPVPDGLPGDVYLITDREPSSVCLPRRDSSSQAIQSIHQPGRWLTSTGLRARRQLDGSWSWEENSRGMLRRGGLILNVTDLEASCLSLPEIADAYVSEQVADNGDQLLISRLVVPLASSDSILACQDHLARQFPAATLPNAWQVVSRLPLTIAGDVDAEALKKLPIIDSSSLSTWEQALRESLSPSRVAILPQETEAERPIYHRDDLPITSRSNVVESSSSEESPDQNFQDHAEGDSGEQAPALLEGLPFSFPEGFPTNLAEMVQHTAQRHSERGIVYLAEPEQSQRQTYAALLEDASRLLAGLRGFDLQPGDKVLFQLPRQRDFISAFWACQLGGFVPVPLAVPPEYSRANAGSSLLLNAIDLLDPPVILTDRARIHDLQALRIEETAQRIAAVEALQSGEATRFFHSADSEDVALCLLTSGSTGKPKAVQQTHGALLYRSLATSMHNGYGPDDISLNWMPLDHVGGIVMFHLRDLVIGAEQYHDGMDDILANPLRWLDLIDRYRLTITWAPNFAYALVNDREAEIRKGHWDLSSMRFILNGGEAVVAKTNRRFLSLLASHGLRGDAMFPAWGMSETCSGVTYHDTFSVDSTSDDDPFVWVGKPIPGFAVRIVDGHSNILSEGRTGSLQVKGPSVTTGYFRNDEQNAEAFTADGWFDTGDRAVIQDGRLAITGREKDTIIINGINYHGHEIEASVEELEGVTVSFTAACAVREPHADTDQLALFFVPVDPRDEALTALLPRIRTCVAEKAGLQARFLIPLSREAIPKTAIGKIQRSKLVLSYQEGAFTDVSRRVDLLLRNENTLPAWFFQRTWVPRKASVRKEKVNREGLLVAVFDAFGKDLVRELREKGRRVIAVRMVAAHHIENDDWQLPPDPSSIKSALRQHLPASDRSFRRIILVPPVSQEVPTSESTWREQVSTPVIVAASFAEGLADRAANQSAELLVLTRGADRIREGDTINPDQAIWQGVLRSLSAERTALTCQLIDVGVGSLSSWLPLLLNESAVSGTGEIGYREGRRFECRLKAVHLPSEVSANKALRKEGFYAITGGTGGIGRLLASFLVHQLNGRVLLMGRQQPDGDHLRELMAELGTERVSYRAVDVTDASLLKDVLDESVQQAGQPLDAVFHLAGNYHERPLAEETSQSLWDGMRVKVLGGFHLERALQASPETRIVYFSSVIAFFGGMGGCAYAAANGYLNGLAAKQDKAYCIDWSMWNEIGMSRGYGLQSLFRQRGYESLNARQGLLSLETVLALPAGRVIVGLDPSKSYVGSFLHEPVQTSAGLSVFVERNLPEPQDRIRLQPKDAFGQTPPCHWHAVNEWPIDEKGQTDPTALRRLITVRSASKEQTAPRNTWERRVAEIWVDLLPIDELGVFDNFFSLGGHSLIATRVVARIADRFGIQLTVRDLFRAPTVAQLAEQLASSDSVGASDRIVPGERPDDLPLSFAQQRLWFLYQLEEPHAAYNIPFVLRIAGRISRHAFESALCETIARHEILRTRFHDRDGVPVQVIDPPTELQLPLIDLCNLDEEDRLKVANQLTHREAGFLFSLEDGPLLRVRLLQLADDEHRLLLTKHHIVSDGWSAGVMVEELGVHYRGVLAGMSSVLPPLPIQYADFALWQRAREELLANQLNYWRAKLDGMPSRLNLMPLRRVSNDVSYAGRSEQVEIPALLTRQLQALAESHQTSLFMVLMTGFQVLLSKYASQSDFGIGSPIANRTRAEIEPLIGFFVNTLVLRATIENGMSALKLLDRVRETTLEAYANQDVPFEQIVDAVQSERDAHTTPLFQVMFILQNTPRGQLDLPGLSIRPVSRPVTSTKFDLSVRLMTHDEGMSGIVEYRTSRFDASAIRRLWLHFSNILQHIADSPERSIERIPLLDEVAARQLIRLWNEPKPDPRSHHHVINRLETVVSRQPDAIAVIHYPERTDQVPTMVTFDCFWYATGTMAAKLQQQGIGREKRVGLFGERSGALITALFGILRAGAVFVPLDPGQPQARIAGMIDDADLSALWIQPGHDFETTFDSSRIMTGDPGYWSRQLPAASGILAEQLAYILFTSGTTGRPKGTGISHAALNHYTAALCAGLPAMPDGSWDLWLPSHTDAGHTVLFGALLSGQPLRLIPPKVVADPDFVPSWFWGQPSTFTKLIPSLLDHVLASDKASECLPWAGMMVGGEAPSWSTLKRFAAIRPGTFFINHYGPTEATVGCAMNQVDDSWSEHFNAVPIGFPLGINRTYILDDAFQPAPEEVPGGLYLAGPGLARGYIGSPAKTAAFFLPDPFADHPGSRMYRSGDLAQAHKDGRIYFMGRQDHQVKIRGFRIELGEITHCLETHTKVREAVVLPRTNANGEAELTAFVTVPSNDMGAESLLRGHLEAQLPHYMVPAWIIVVDQLPRSTSGKLDRKALQTDPRYAPNRDDTQYRDLFVAPRDDIEMCVASIWSELLNQPRIGVHDNFFSLGGHSLLATRIIARIRKRFGIGLPVSALFSTPTVAGLASAISGNAQTVTETGPVPVPRDPSGVVPLSFSQARLWFLERLEPGNPAYHIAHPVWLEGQLDVVRLASALNRVASRHESLRTTFGMQAGQPVQRIAETVHYELIAEDWRGLSNADSQVRQTAEQMQREPFDLEIGPLMRVRLIQTADDRYALLLVLHHLISDGWSMGLFLRDLLAFYADEHGSCLKSLPLQYGDYATWQEQWLASEHYQRQLIWWRESLADLPHALDLPLDRPRPKRQTFHGEALSFHFQPEIASQIIELARSRGITPFMVLLAGFGALLHRYCGQTDIAIGTPVANRRFSELERLIGFFANTLVLRLGLHDRPNFQTIMARTEITTQNALSHGDMPFEKLVEELRPRRDLSISPLFQVMFILQNAADMVTEADVSGLPFRIEPLAFERAGAPFDLTLSMRADESHVGGTLHFNTDLFERETAIRFVDHYRQLLTATIQNPLQPIVLLPLLSSHEQQLLLRDWNPGSDLLLPNLCLHEAFRATAAQRPDEIVLVYECPGGRICRLTRAALALKVDALVDALHQRGVRPGERVGICLSRKPEMAIALLAILETGAAYVPMDPAYPNDRLTMMAEDAEISAVVIEPADMDRFPGIPFLSVADCAENLSCKVAKPKIDPHWPAYLIYTSGSTGRPKGVLVRHHSVAVYLDWARRDLPSIEDASVCASTSLSFDISAFEWFLPITGTGNIVLADNLLALPDLTVVNEITLIQTVPSVLTSLLEFWNLPPNVETLVVGGEPLTTALVEQVDRLPNQPRLFNVYGPTEDTIFSTFTEASLDLLGTHAAPGIGRPISHTRVYLVDRDFQLTPIGVAGELLLAGEGLAVGYQNRPAITAERLVPNPWSNSLGSRLYRTGDLARRDQTGELHFRGRLDFQVKVRGFRIELGEIEACIERYDGISEAVVLALKSPDDTHHLIAYVRPNNTAEIDVAAIVDWLRNRLPQHMIPSRIVKCDVWPRLSNGKIDRGKLSRQPSPELATNDEHDGATSQPRDMVEWRLHEIWCELLGDDGIGIHDSFFDLGGHSLLAVRLLNRVLQVFERDLPISLLFQDPTIAGMAEALRHDGGHSGWRSLIQLKRGAGPILYFLHPPAGTLMAYVPLIQALNVPAVGFLAPGLEAGQTIQSTINDLAAFHLNELLEHQPEGPYHLIGWSAAGLVAYELARQLTERGKKVAYIGLIDTGLLANLPPAEEDDAATLIGLWARDLGLPAEAIQNDSDPLMAVLEKAKAEGLVPREMTLDAARRRIAVSGAHLRAGRAYQPEPIRAPVVLYRARDNEGLAVLGPDLGWRSLARGGYTRIELPGDHGTLMEPPLVSELAKKIEQSLRGLTDSDSRPSLSTSQT